MRDSGKCTDGGYPLYTRNYSFDRCLIRVSRIEWLGGVRQAFEPMVTAEYKTYLAYMHTTSNGWT